MCDNKVICSLVSVKHCNVKCRYGCCTCDVTSYSYNYHDHPCNVCCCCQCDRRGFENATNTSITVPEGTKQPANPDSGCGCLLLRTAMLKI